MERAKNETDRCPFTQTKRIKQIILQSFLTILSLNIYAASTVAMQENQTTHNTTTIFPIPINNTTMFMNLAANASTVMAERVSASAERRQHVVWFAESHTGWGLQYSLGSSSLDDGFDCSGFVRYVLNYFDFKASRSSNEQYKDGTLIPVALARGGDLVFFGEKKGIHHVAMVVSNDDKGLVVVHSTCSRGIIKENITESAYWKPKLKDKAVNIIGL